MQDKKEIWITGPSLAGCDALRAVMELQEDLDVHVHVQQGDHLDISAFANSQPGLVMLDLAEKGTTLLADWAKLPEKGRAPLIVIGDTHDSQLMRSAMQIGARDYFTHPVQADELLAVTRQSLRETMVMNNPARGKLTSVIDSKGGSGASFVACNLAHILATHLEHKTALIDMDLQFGALPLSLDLHPTKTLFDAIGNAEQLDSVVLKTYMTQHSSGLHVLGTMSEQLGLPWEVSIEALQKVLQVSMQTYEHVVADLPRQIDPFTGAVLSASDKVLVIMQRSFAHLRDAQRMFSLLRGYLGLNSDRIVLVINRSDDNSPITDDHIKDAIRPTEILRIPNDFEHVTESLNIGIPLYQGARNAPVTRALCDIAGRLDNVPAATVTSEKEPTPKRSGFARVLGLVR